MHNAKKLRNSKSAKTLSGPNAKAMIQFPVQALPRFAGAKTNP